MSKALTIVESWSAQPIVGALYTTDPDLRRFEGLYVQNPLE